MSTAGRIRELKAQRGQLYKQVKAEQERIEALEKQVRVERRNYQDIIADLNEQVAALESKEVCNAPHEDSVIEGCPYCRLESEDYRVAQWVTKYSKLEDEFDKERKQLFVTKSTLSNIQEGVQELEAKIERGETASHFMVDNLARSYGREEIARQEIELLNSKLAAERKRIVEFEANKKLLQGLLDDSLDGQARQVARITRLRAELVDARTSVEELKDFIKRRAYPSEFTSNQHDIEICRSSGWDIPESK